VTDEILVRMVERDPLLSQYSIVIVDDVHERTLATDLVLGLLKQIRRKKRPTLRVVCCSATVDAEALCTFLAPPSLEGNNGASAADKCSIVSVDGRQHPVDVLHLESPASNYLQSALDACAQIVRSNDPGDILCFMPTAQHVDDAIRTASEQDDLFPHRTVDLLPLHGSLPYSSQLKVFAKADPKKRVIIFATSIAETSITYVRTACKSDYWLNEEKKWTTHAFCLCVFPPPPAFLGSGTWSIPASRSGTTLTPTRDWTGGSWSRPARPRRRSARVGPDGSSPGRCTGCTPSRG
jgi:superfamily II DNA/RNA helicase